MAPILAKLEHFQQKWTPVLRRKMRQNKELEQFTEPKAQVKTALEGHFGLYLALTGAHIKWGDCWQFGLATHAIPSHAYPPLRQRLIEEGNVNCLDEAHQPREFETSPQNRALINQCFAAPNVAAIIKRLETHAQQADDFAARTAKTLHALSPTSLKIIYKHQALARHLTLDESLKLDYHLACQMLGRPDFFEGVRARLVDKDNAPNWQPALLADVKDDEIDAYFLTENHENELTL